MKDYYEPQPSIIVQRFKFNTRVRNSDESVSAYLAALRALAEHCSYGTTELLKEMLRDRWFAGSTMQVHVYRGSFWLKRILLTTRQSQWPLLLKRQKEIPGTSETPARSLTRKASTTRTLGVSGMLVEAGRRLQTTLNLMILRATDVEAPTSPQHANLKIPSVSTARKRDIWHEFVRLKLGENSQACLSPITWRSKTV